MPSQFTPSERAQHLETFVRWLRIRRENTQRLIEHLGTPSERGEVLLIAEDQTPLNELLNLVGETLVKELDFLSEAKFPGIGFSSDVDDAEIEAIEAIKTLFNTPTNGPAQ